ncbi:MAG: hypothetical protein ACOYLX_09540 [Burkholderiaceae bacterium]
MRDTRAFIDRLCDPLRTPGKRTWFLVQPYSRGDTYLTCALIEAFRATHGTVTDDLVLLVKRSHLPIATLFERHIPRVAGVDDAQLNQVASELRNMGVRTGLEPDRAVFVHPMHMDDGRADALTNLPDVSQKHMYQQLLRLPFDTVLSTPVVPQAWRDEAQAFAREYRMPVGRSVILMPDANSFPTIEDAFWERLVPRLKAAGWTPFTNTFGRNGAPRSAPFAGSTGIAPPLNVFLALAEHAGWIVSTLTGTANILITARAACRKTILTRGPAPGTTLRFNDLIELDSAFPYGFQKTFDGEIYNIEELEIRGPDDFDPVAREICEGLNATSGAVPDASPMIRLVADTSPGDVLDRITILEIKEALLSGPAAIHNVRREMTLLRARIGPHLKQAQPGLEAAVRDLKAINLAAWNTNEVIFKGFADRFGGADWQLDPTDATALARSEEMVKAFRESQRLNRERVNTKNRINRLMNHVLIEEKSYDAPQHAIASAQSLGVQSVPAAARAPAGSASPVAAAVVAAPAAPLGSPAPAPSVPLTPGFSPLDGHLAKVGLHAVEWELSPAQRDTVATAIANEVNRIVPPRPNDIPASAVARLRDDGIVAVGRTLTPTQVAEVAGWFAARPCYSAHASVYSDGVARPVDEAARRGHYGSYPLADALAAPHLLELAMNDEVIGLCERYLGCLPTIYSVHVWWTFAGHPTPGRTHGYHRDQDDHRFLSMFTYLTDVGAQDGPIDFLLGTHRPEVVRSALEAYAGAHPGGAVPTEDRFFPPHAGNGYDDAPDKIPLSYDVLFPHLLATLTGGAGTSFIADTFALHRGTPPTRHHRLACWIRYGLSRHRIYELDRNEPVPASRLGARLPGGREAEWITRLIVDRSR